MKKYKVEEPHNERIDKYVCELLRRYYKGGCAKNDKK